MSEEINHPARYNQGGIECWDVEKAFFGVSSHVDHLVQGALEYELRFRRKNGAQDLRKAAILLTRAAELMEAGEDGKAHMDPKTWGVGPGKREVPRG